MIAQAVPLARATVDGADRLLSADEPLVGLHLRCGGELPGSQEYDHIVPVLGIDSKSRLSTSDRRYRPSDVISFSDNSGANPSSLYRIRFDRFQLSRTQANDSRAPLYSLQSRPMNYAAAVTGVLDPDRVTVPVRLTTDADGEGLQEGVRLGAPPAPIPIELTATVTIPNPAVGYSVYLYDDFAKVPIRDFNSARFGRDVVDKH